MTIDRTLKVSGGLLRSRGVLSRTERIAELTKDGKFDPKTDSPFGLPKVRVKHSKAGTKAKKVEAAKPEGAEGAEAAAPAAEAAKGAKATSTAAAKGAKAPAAAAAKTGRAPAGKK
jgi:small basic protein (TIGR04137 family)